MTDEALPFLIMTRHAGIKLTGDLNGWATTKDLILYLTGKLTVKVRKHAIPTGRDLTGSREELDASSNTSVLGSSTNHVPVSWWLRASSACLTRAFQDWQQFPTWGRKLVPPRLLSRTPRICARICMLRDVPPLLTQRTRRPQMAFWRRMKVPNMTKSSKL